MVYTWQKQVLQVAVVLLLVGSLWIGRNTSAVHAQRPPGPDSPLAAMIAGQPISSIPAGAAQWIRFDYSFTPEQRPRPTVAVRLLNAAQNGLQFEIWSPERLQENWLDDEPVGRGTQEIIAGCSVTLPDGSVARCATYDHTWVGGFGALGTYYLRVVNTSNIPIAPQIIISGRGLGQCVNPSGSLSPNTAGDVTSGDGFVQVQCEFPPSTSMALVSQVPASPSLTSAAAATPPPISATPTSAATAAASKSAVAPTATLAATAVTTAAPVATAASTGAPAVPPTPGVTASPLATPASPPATASPGQASVTLATATAASVPLTATSAPTQAPSVVAATTSTPVATPTTTPPSTAVVTAPATRAPTSSASPTATRAASSIATATLAPTPAPTRILTAVPSPTPAPTPSASGSAAGNLLTLDVTINSAGNLSIGGFDMRAFGLEPLPGQATQWAKQLDGAHLTVQGESVTLAVHGTPLLKMQWSPASRQVVTELAARSGFAISSQVLVRAEEWISSSNVDITARYTDEPSKPLSANTNKPLWIDIGPDGQLTIEQVPLAVTLDPSFMQTVRQGAFQNILACWNRGVLRIRADGKDLPVFTFDRTGASTLNQVLGLRIESGLDPLFSSKFGVDIALSGGAHQVGALCGD